MRVERESKVQGFEMSFVRIESLSFLVAAPLLDTHVTQKSQIKRSKERKIYGRDDEDEDGNRGCNARDAQGWPHLCRHSALCARVTVIIPREIIALTLRAGNLVTVTSV